MQDDVGCPSELIETSQPGRYEVFGELFAFVRRDAIDAAFEGFRTSRVDERLYLHFATHSFC